MLEWTWELVAGRWARRTLAQTDQMRGKGGVLGSWGLSNVTSLERSTRER
jgi:hypothetical protein